MAIIRKGVKLGKGGMNDVRVSLLSKQRAKGLLRKAKILDDGRGRKQFETDARGEVDLYRRAVTRAEGFDDERVIGYLEQAKNAGNLFAPGGYGTWQSA